MTLAELGEMLKQSPKVRDYFADFNLDDIPDELFALKTLEVYPRYWDLIAPGSDRIHELSHADSRANSWFRFFLSQETLNTKRANNLAVIQQEVDNKHHIALVFEAAQHGVDVPTLMQMKLKEHELELERRKHAYLREHTRLASEVADEIKERRLTGHQQRTLSQGDGEAPEGVGAAHDNGKRVAEAGG